MVCVPFTVVNPIKAPTQNEGVFQLGYAEPADPGDRSHVEIADDTKQDHIGPFGRERRGDQIDRKRVDHGRIELLPPLGRDLGQGLLGGPGPLVRPLMGKGVEVVCDGRDSPGDGDILCRQASVPAPVPSLGMNERVRADSDQRR